MHDENVVPPPPQSFSGAVSAPPPPVIIEARVDLIVSVHYTGISPQRRSRFTTAMPRPRSRTATAVR